MMGRQTGDQSQLFYLFNLERRIPTGHLLRRINPVVARILVELREKLVLFYSDIGRPSIDPELMIRMLIVGYCYGIRSERQLCEEVELHLAYGGSTDRDTGRASARPVSRSVLPPVTPSGLCCRPRWRRITKRAARRSIQPAAPALILQQVVLKS